MKNSGPIRISPDSPKHLVKLNPDKFTRTSNIGFAGASLKWFSAYEPLANTTSANVLAIKLRDLIVQGISFNEYHLECPPALIGEEPAIYLYKDRFHFMQA